jgi:diguanylate cyclase (GGDEF)-like protein
MDMLRGQLKALRIQHNGGALGTVTMSGGVAQFPVHGKDHEELLRAADDALYRAKQAGRNNIQAAG